jgi:hypothetical protein
LKILITGGKSATTLKLLKAFAGHEIVLADYGDIPSFPSANYTFITLGEVNDAIAHNILNICLDYGIEMVLPLHEFEINHIAKSKVLFQEFNIQVLLPEQTDILKYFYPQADIKPGMKWYYFLEGALQFPENAAQTVIDLGREKELNGVFYIPDDPEGLTAILFTIP